MAIRLATRWGIASAGMISHDFTNALSTLDKNEHKVIMDTVLLKKLHCFIV